MVRQAIRDLEIEHASNTFFIDGIIELWLKVEEWEGRGGDKEKEVNGENGDERESERERLMLRGGGNTLVHKSGATLHLD